MALTRKMLKAMGIEDEKIEQIIEAHSETVSALKEKCEELTEKAESGDKALKDLEKLEAATKSSEDWKAKFEKLENEVKTEKATAATKTAYRKLLKENGVGEKYIDTVMKVQDLSKIELDENGNIKGAEEIGKDIKAEWADLIPTVKEVKAEPQTPPTVAPTRKTKAEIMAIKDTDERQQAIKENIDLFQQ